MTKRAPRDSSGHVQQAASMRLSGISRPIAAIVLPSKGGRSSGLAGAEIGRSCRSTESRSRATPHPHNDLRQIAARHDHIRRPARDPSSAATSPPRPAGIWRLRWKFSRLVCSPLIERGAFPGPIADDLHHQGPSREHTRQHRLDEQPVREDHIRRARGASDCRDRPRTCAAGAPSDAWIRSTAKG